MARFVALSSAVARGHVGLRATVPALEQNGHDVIALPSIALSSHAAYAHVAGAPVDLSFLERMSDALDDNGWFQNVDTVITGYLPSREHVTFASGLVARIRHQSPRMTFVCDPVIGDDPKGLYVTTSTAEAVRDVLLPSASVVTPNAFELAWMSGCPVSGLDSAIAAARTLTAPAVLATSVPEPPKRLATVLVTPQAAAFTSVPRRDKVPSGTGDLLTALFAANSAGNHAMQEAMAISGAWLERILTASGATDDLNLAPLFGAAPAPLPVRSVADTNSKPEA